MGILANDGSMLVYIYSSESHLGKQVLGYAEGLDKKLRVIDIAKEKLGHAVWADIGDAVGVGLGELFTTEGPDAPENAKGGNFSTDDWLMLIDHEPALLQNPIAINGDRAKIISGRDGLLEFYGVDSAGLEKTFGHEPPTAKKTTDNENFVSSDGTVYPFSDPPWPIAFG